MDRFFQVQLDTDFGWVDIGSPTVWYQAVSRYEDTFNTRIVELTEAGDFIREVTDSELVQGYPK